MIKFIYLIAAGFYLWSYYNIDPKWWLLVFAMPMIFGGSIGAEFKYQELKVRLSQLESKGDENNAEN